MVPNVEHSLTSPVAPAKEAGASQHTGKHSTKNNVSITTAWMVSQQVTAGYQPGGLAAGKQAWYTRQADRKQFWRSLGQGSLRLP